jgi:choline dehydrogenase-like flavoprotein
MGTARMSHDPQHGVTNPYGRTHDVPNLFLTDGSVHPTAGAANPTLTIVSLTLRQADHISREIAANRL